MAETQEAPPAVGGGAHTANYLDGAAATDAFQDLIDRGLFASGQAPAAKQATPQSQTPTAPAAASQPEPLSTPEAHQPEAQADDSQRAAAEVEPPTYASVDEYLTKNSLDRESFLELPITIKVDGKDSQVPLKDLLRNTQQEAHFTRKSQEFAEQQKTWQAEQAAAKQALIQQTQTAATVAQLAHNQLLHEFQNVPWEQLKVQDPNQYLIKRNELNERYGAIQQEMQRIGSIQQQQQAEAQQQLGQQIAQERELMYQSFPEWRDPQKFQAARAELSAFAKSNGFTDAEFSSIVDHRYLKVLQAASRYAALQARSPATLKIVRAAPPMAAPGARVQRDPTTERFQQARRAMKANPRSEDAQIAAFSALAERGA